MKKLIICILAAMIFVTNVYADEMWFLLTPNMDSDGRLIDKDNYKDIENVEVKFKIVEIIKDIVD